MESKRLGPDGPCPSAAPEPRLPFDLIFYACGFFSPNEIACTGRLLCKAAAQHFAAPLHGLVRLGQPVPPHAFAGRYGRGANPQPLRQLSLKLKERLLALTASSGVVENVATLVGRMEPPFWWKGPRGRAGADGATVAARARHMPVVRFLMERGYPFDAGLVLSAVLQHCDLADMGWLLQQWAVQDSPLIKEGKLSFDIINAAARSVAPDSTAKLKWLLGRFGPAMEGWMPRAAHAAARADNLPGLEWALEQMVAVPTELLRSLLRDAVASNALRTTAWLLGREGVEVTDIAAINAAELGHAEMVRMLLTRARTARRAEPALDWRALVAACLDEALGSGRLDAVQAVLGVAAAHGGAGAAVFDDNAGYKFLGGYMGYGLESVETARWLRQRGGWPAQTPREAVLTALSACHVTMLAFLRDEVGAPWPAPVPALHAAVGSEARGEDVVAVLRWLHERGCPLSCDAAATKDALARGEPQLLQWLWGKGLLGPAQLSDASLLECAARSGCEAAVEWLLAAGCPMGQDGRAYLAAGRNGDLDMLRCLRRLGVPWGPDTVLRAVEQGGSALPVHVVRWMVGEGGAPCDGRAVGAAAEGGELRGWLRAAAHAAAGGAAGQE